MNGGRGRSGRASGTLPLLRHAHWPLHGCVHGDGAGALLRTDRRRHPFIRALLASRTEWCLAVFSHAAALGAEVIVIGDDAAHHGGPLVSPRMLARVRAALSPPDRCRVARAGDLAQRRGHRQAAADGGRSGARGARTGAVVDVAGQTKAEYAGKLVLLGNADVRPLCEPDLEAVRREVAAAPRRAGRAASCSRPATASSPA